MDKEKQHLFQFCAPGASVREEMVASAENVRLRVFIFNPAEPTKNPAVFFVAGWMSLIDGWQNVLREMTKDFTVFYIETREKKSSMIKGDAGFGIQDIGIDIVKVIHHFRAQSRQYVLMGSSLGATAIVDCCRYLEIPPRALILISPNAVFRIPRFARFFIRIFPPALFILFRPFVKWYLRTFRLDVQVDKAQYEKYCRTLDNADPWKSKKTARALWNYQLWDKLELVKFPALIIDASKDQLHEPYNVSRMAAIMPRATYLDMETNARNHSKEVVEQIRYYLTGLRD